MIGVRNLLSAKLGDATSITSTLAPGGPVALFPSMIAGAARMSSPQDIIVVLGGTNSIADDLSPLQNELKNVLTTIPNAVFFTETPARHDRPEENGKIALLNEAVDEIITQCQNAARISVSDLQREDYTQHGLHLNRRGKHHVASRIAAVINPFLF